jgi:predicted nucleic acid-binding protein
MAANLSLLRREATVVPITVSVHGVVADAADDVILATALSGQATYVVSGDRKVQAVGEYQGVAIRSPDAFLTVLAAGEAT